ncbi:MAG: glycosyltransferase family 4 protein [Candidatus Methanomethylophilaceae archaeon]|nr:glycosyltransferase family 4 protein [Candidatus Methanomethylophilaceae archaeon]
MHDTATIMASRGHDVTILTSRLPGTEEEEKTPEGYRILRLESKFHDVYNPPIVHSDGVLEALESLDPDVVNHNYRWAPSFDKNVARFDGRKVFTVHNMWGEGRGIVGAGSRINDALFLRRYADSYGLFVCVSEFVRRATVERGIPECRTVTVPSCLNALPPENASPEGDYILSLGRLVRPKGLDYLVEAMRDVDCKLYICGKGPEEERLARKISLHGLQDRVEMLGYVNEEEKQRLMRGCRLFVMPSVFESFGLAAVEQMSYGRPIVCSKVNGLPETVGDAGILVPPKDPKAIASAVNRLLGDDGLRSDLGRKAYAQAGKYVWENHADRFVDLMTRVNGGEFDRKLR